MGQQEGLRGRESRWQARRQGQLHSFLPLPGPQTTPHLEAGLQRQGARAGLPPPKDEGTDRYNPESTWEAPISSAPEL